MKITHQKRGVTLLGLMAMIVVLGAMCALILDRSAETYRAGAMLEWRLQARAAAEGVAALAAADPAHPPAPQTLGAAIVTCAAPIPGAQDQSISLPLSVVIRPPGTDMDRFTARFTARFINGRLLRLED